MQLQKTEDIVFFPALFSLNPGEERRIRIGSPAVAASEREQTFRIFVEELAPAKTAASPSGVRVLTKMGIPIFLRPAKEHASATLSVPQVRGRAVTFSLSNTGAVHFVPRRVVARFGDAAGNTVSEQPLSGWYVLAGGRRDYEVALPPADCMRISSVVIEAELPFATLSERADMVSGVCGT
jgi:fimbrial chaperone protein